MPRGCLDDVRHELTSLGIRPIVRDHREGGRPVDVTFTGEPRQLLDQWVERLSTFLGLPAKSIGRVSGGRGRTTGAIDVALIQSLIKKGVVDDRVADYGHVVVDECHHVSAQTFEAVV